MWLKFPSILRYWNILKMNRYSELSKWLPTSVRKKFCIRLWIQTLNIISKNNILNPSLSILQWLIKSNKTRLSMKYLFKFLSNTKLQKIQTTNKNILLMLLKFQLKLFSKMKPWKPKCRQILNNSLRKSIKSSRYLLSSSTTKKPQKFKSK